MPKQAEMGHFGYKHAGVCYQARILHCGPQIQQHRLSSFDRSPHAHFCVSGTPTNISNASGCTWAWRKERATFWQEEASDWERAPSLARSSIHFPCDFGQVTSLLWPWTMHGVLIWEMGTENITQLWGIMMSQCRLFSFNKYIMLV